MAFKAYFYVVHTYTNILFLKKCKILLQFNVNSKHELKKSAEISVLE